MIWGILYIIGLLAFFLIATYKTDMNTMLVTCGSIIWPIALFTIFMMWLILLPDTLRNMKG